MRLFTQDNVTQHAKGYRRTFIPQVSLTLRTHSLKSLP